MSGLDRPRRTFPRIIQGRDRTGLYALAVDEELLGYDDAGIPQVAGSAGVGPASPLKPDLFGRNSP